MLILLIALLSPAAQADEAAKKAPAAPAPGITHESLQQRVNDNLGMIKGCYDSNVKLDEHPSGNVNTRFTVQPDGKVSNVTILSSELNNGKIENCLKGVIEKFIFPAPTGGVAVQVDYPFNFSVEKKGPPPGEAPKKAEGKKKKK